MAGASPLRLPHPLRLYHRINPEASPSQCVSSCPSPRLGVAVHERYSFLQPRVTWYPTGRWGTRVGVILAVAGSAVGLGNFLRFPGQAAQNGGGAFLIPYFCALLLLGIPIGWAEWAYGPVRRLKGFPSAPGIMGIIGRAGPGDGISGVIGVLIPLAVSFYYVFIRVLDLRLLPQMLHLPVASGSMSRLRSRLRPPARRPTTPSSPGQPRMGRSSRRQLASARVRIVVFRLNIYFIYRGLSKGIEAFCRIAMPLMAVCALIVLVRC